MESITKFSIENIKEIEEIYKLIKDTIDNKEIVIDFKLKEVSENESFELLKYMFPKILFEKLESTKYRIILEKKNEEYKKILDKVTNINYII